MEATPEWVIEGSMILNNGVPVCRFDDTVNVYQYAKENAVLICSSVRSHDKLVEAVRVLKKALITIQKRTIGEPPMVETAQRTAHNNEASELGLIAYNALTQIEGLV